MTPMNMALGCVTDGSGVSRTTSERSGAKTPVPTRRSTPYTVHAWSVTGAGELAPVVVVVVVVVLVVVGVVAELVGVVGDGDTIEGDVVVVEAVGLLLGVVVDALDVDCVRAGVVPSATSPLAKGSRGVPTGAAGAGSRAGVCFAVAAAPATGGAGGTGATSARAFFRNTRGTTTTATSRSTTTGHSRRWSRSRRSELIIGLQG